MARARKQQIDLDTTRYYHCISRCVRQAFLCGKSKESGKSYAHRRAWVVSRLKALTEIFAIKICAYAIMSNHYHLVIYVDVDAAKMWSAEEVMQRWKCLFKGAPAIEQLHSDTAQVFIEQWRMQLTDISWFMRCLNEYLARRANLEEGCKGRFWEGRYKSQALLDEAALLTCMAYVDLNPVRAGLSISLEESDFTSIQQRLHAYANKKETSAETPQLMHFEKRSVKKSSIYAENTHVPFCERAYFELVHWTGTAVRGDKKGFIPTSVKSTLNSNAINEKQWIQSIKYFGSNYSWLVGRVEEIKERCLALNKKWLRGIRASNTFFLNNAI